MMFSLSLLTHSFWVVITFHIHPVIIENVENFPISILLFLLVYFEIIEI